MIRRILLGGLVGGIAGGLVVAVIQALTTTPMILYAETFENDQAGSAGSVILAAAHSAAAEGVSGAFDLDRFLMTALATLGIATGYAWIAMGALHAAGGEITARRIVPWAVAGFFVTGLAPAFGLAPELPGVAYVDVAARQIWWLGTAVAAAGGVVAFAFGRKPLWVFVGIVLIAAPHVIGAPAPVELFSQTPAEIAAHFASASLGIQALVWVVPAAIAGYTVSRMGPG